MKVKNYKNFTVAVIGSHSALDVCRGAKDEGFRTLVIVEKGRDKTYADYFRTQKGGPSINSGRSSIGCVDEVLYVEKFKDILSPKIQKILVKKNSIFVPHRSFEVYINDYDAIENDFKVTPQQIEKAITNKTKLFLFSSPSNPTGTVYNKNELNQFAEVFAKHKHVMIMSDEIYEQILYEGKHESIGQFNEIKNQLIVVNGVSKGYAMTGWRIGYIAAPEWLAKACTKLQSQFTSGASAVSQKAAFKAISGDKTETYKMRDILKKRRNLMVELFKEIPDFKTNIPKGAFYFFADVKNYFGKTFENNIIKNDVDLCLFLLNNAHVAVVGGSSFGSPDYLRFSYATPENNLIEAVRRIKDSLEILEL